ncbi:MAG: hypothetical protein KAR17_22110 [Cyclobacteriaceae bacterium]|nr:hypothetical protein [Cyclobacteriaceae bacterium]
MNLELSDLRFKDIWYSFVEAAKIYETTKNRKVKKSFSETIKKAKKGSWACFGQTSQRI